MSAHIPDVHTVDHEKAHGIAALDAPESATQNRIWPEQLDRGMGDRDVRTQPVSDLVGRRLHGLSDSHLPGKSRRVRADVIGEDHRQDEHQHESEADGGTVQNPQR